MDLSVSCFVYVTTTYISSGSGVSFSGKVLREKTFVNFVVVWLFLKAFLHKIGGVLSIVAAKASNL